MHGKVWMFSNLIDDEDIEFMQHEFISYKQAMDYYELGYKPNADLADLRLSDEMIDLLKSGRIDNTLLCELAAHPDFPRLMADLEIYVNGTALKQAQGANAIVDTMSATVIKKHNPG